MNKLLNMPKQTTWVINNLAGGRNNLESGLQTGLNVVATLAWWDWNSMEEEVDDESSASETMSIGAGSISTFLFAPWFIAMFLIVGFVSTRKDSFQLSDILEEESSNSGLQSGSADDGITLIDNYKARVFTLCALYVAQGLPWGFITVTFVTYLAVEGVAPGEVAVLLTLGTLPSS